MFKATTPSEKNEEKVLHGLVIVSNLRNPKVTVDHALLHAAPLLRRRAIYLHFVSVASVVQFFYCLAILAIRERQYRYDFAIFNDPGVLGFRNWLGNILLRMFYKSKISVFIYWHVTDWVFERLQKTKPSMVAKIAHIVQSDSVVNFTVSEVCSESLKKVYPKSNPIKIYNCTKVPRPFDEVLTPSQPPVVVNVASIQERKGTDLFVGTAINVCQRHPSVRFVWLGDGKRFGTWESDVKESGFQNRIVFPGYVDEPYSMIQRASVLFLSSRDDPFPKSVLEAMCLGRTIVAFNVGGAPEALAGEGILVEPFDTDAAAQAILDCLDQDPQKLVNQKVRDTYYGLYTPEKFAERMGNRIREQINH